MNKLQKALIDYLSIRRALGFKLEGAGHFLPDFVAFLERHGSPIVTTELAVEWASLPAQATPQWWAQRLIMVRSFARHLQSIDPKHQVPPRSLLCARSRRLTPFLYAAPEINALIAAAGSLCSSKSSAGMKLRAATYTTLVGLLATTGMRVGEAIRLDHQDVDWLEESLVIRNSKFGKSREVPISKTTIVALRAYARARDQSSVRSRSNSFFVSSRGTRLLYVNVWSTFEEIVRRAGLKPRSPRCRPRLHDLRHSFAVRTLLNWYATDVDVEANLPLLSTYLGHFDPASTYWYLSAAPELLSLASKRLERTMGRLP